MARKSKAFLRRSAAAKKGWVTRRRRQRGVLVRLGYASSKDNAFAMEIEIASHKRLSDRNLVDLCVNLLREGHFDSDSQAVGGPSDVQWTAPLINFEQIIARNLKRTPGTAHLLSFDRDGP